MHRAEVTEDNGPMIATVRPLTDLDAETSRRMGAEAFGMPATPPTTPATLEQAGRHWFGSFDGDVLAARMVGSDFVSQYGDAAVTTCGIGGVTVAAEYRSRGLLGDLFATTLRAARDSGAAISTLYPSAPGIYRRFGYEVVTDFTTARVPTHALAAIRRPVGVTTRRATVDDLDAVRDVYTAWTRGQNGTLTRRGVCFDPEAAQQITEYDGVTLAVDEDGTVIGYVAWDRGQGSSATSTIEVSDLYAIRLDGYRALLSMIGSFVTVTPHTTIEGAVDDLARMSLPSLRWDVEQSSPYMMRVLDVALAVTQRTYARVLSTDVSFTLSGDFLTENDGGYAITISGGQATCTRVDPVDRTLTPQGLALLYAGVQSCANLRTLGYLDGGDTDDDDTWDVLFSGRPHQIRNYF